jgi:hypothetical protein
MGELAGRSWSELARAEASFLWRTFYGPAKRTFWIVGGLMLAWVLVVIVSGDAGEFDGAADVIAWVLVAIGYSAYVGVCFGIAVGIVVVVWRTVGAWSFVPIVLVPACIALSLWAFSGLLQGQAVAFLDALRTAADEHEWAVAALGPAARVGPVILVIAAPLLLADVIALLIDPGVLWAFALLALEVFAALAVGALPALAVSFVLLLVAYVRRFRARHGLRGA